MRKPNLKLVLLALFGAVMGQGVVWYTGQFYAQTFLERTCSVEFVQTRYILLSAIALGTGFFILWGWLSDKIGRKWIMLTGMLLAVLTYRPIYKAIYSIANSNNKVEIAEKGFSGLSVSIDPATLDSLVTKTTVKIYTSGNTVREVSISSFKKDRTADPKVVKSKVTWLSPSNFWMLVMLVFIQILYVTMVYGPIAAFLVELFPTRIRYTSMSLPYHIGNGVFGGLTPLIATRLFDVSKTTDNPIGDPFVGLWYPIVIAAVCFVIGVLYLPNKTADSVET